MDSTLQIDDLVYLICRFTRPQDAARLARTSRRFFHFATPIVWRHVDGITHLFGLVAGANIYTITNREDHLMTCISLPETLSVADFERFNVYAPFVKSLEILGSRARTYYGVPNAQSLLFYAQQHELLPNLEILKLTAEQSRKTESLFWVHVFASPSVREIWLFPNQHWESPLITASNASDLIKTIVKRCPKIQTLRAFVDRDDIAQPRGQQLNNLFANEVREPLANTLAHATSLTRLVGNTTLLERDVLATLGRLPLLSSLEIFCTRHEWAENVQDSDQVLQSNDMFPMLDRLRFRNANERHLKFIRDSPILVARLTALHISLSVPLTRPAINLLLTNIPLVCQNCPQLTCLTLEFNQKRNKSAVCLISEDIFRCLERLPLTELVISCAALDLEVGHDRLAEAWPDMEVLIWTARSIPVVQLNLFARHMPKLRHLGLDIKLVPVPDNTDAVGAALFRNHTLQVLEGGFYELNVCTADEAYEVQRYMFTLYPNVRLEIWPDTPLEPRIEWKMNDHFLNLLNAFNATKRGSSNDEEATQLLFKRKWYIAKWLAQLVT